MDHIKKILAVFFSAVVFAACAEEKRNVLFIAVDDLNDWVGCMGGHPQAITPNMDRLAEEGMLFLNAHCQAPICGPSRASIMTGLSPMKTGIYLQNKDSLIRESGEAAAAAVFMPDWFEQNGYQTLAAGKVFHNGDGNGAFDVYENSGGSPKPAERMKWPAKDWPVQQGPGTDWGPLGRDEEYTDFRTAAFGVKVLKQKHEKPFFLTVGFNKPHVPWYVPQKWFDLHPLDTIQTPPYKADDMDDVPEIAKRIMDMPMMPTTDWLIEHGEWKNLIQAYLACSTFVDAQVGKVLDALRESEYADNTVVVLWSDHGYHVGEKNRFAKQSLWERSARSVLMFKVPRMGGGGRCDAPVQLLDMYPPLLALCGLPANPQNEGHSLLPLLNDPNAAWDHIAFTSYGQGNLSMRSRTHRYIVYEDGSEELYDMTKDPNEWTNLAGNPEYDAIKAAFKKKAPETQVRMSPKSGYWCNEYWMKKTAETWSDE